MGLGGEEEGEGGEGENRDRVRQHEGRSQGRSTVQRSDSFLSSVPGTELSSSGLAVSAFTNGAILPAL